MMITSPNKNFGNKKENVFVFLGGPIQGAPNWQKETEEFIENWTIKPTLINPRRDRIDNSFIWEEQVKWETEFLRMSDIILFWIPAPIEEIPGRDYAQTTRMELIENLVRGKKIILGIDPSIHARRYMVEKFNHYQPNSIVHNTLEECMIEVKKEVRNIAMRKGAETFFTSDTHFSSQRALELSKRPFINTKEMDWTIIERWNQKVSPNSYVYHLGDFGNFEMAKYLNGHIIFLRGNYEKDLELPKDLSFAIIEKPTMSFTAFEIGKFRLGHEPIKVKEALKEDEFGLFGHIHGRQKIKKFGIDVGVDANNFAPVSLDEIIFYKEAIEKYYDNEVFV